MALGDLDLDIDLRHEVFNAVEQRNLWAFAQRTRKNNVAPPATSVMAILQDFCEEKIAAQFSAEPLVSMKALVELRTVLGFLVSAGQVEFEMQIDQIDCGIVRIGRAARDQLVTRFLARETPAEELELISSTLVSMIEAGQWPEWRTEFDAAVETARLRNAS